MFCIRDLDIVICNCNSFNISIFLRFFILSVLIALMLLACDLVSISCRLNAVDIGTAAAWKSLRDMLDVRLFVLPDREDLICTFHIFNSIISAILDWVLRLFHLSILMVFKLFARDIIMRCSLLPEIPIAGLFSFRAGIIPLLGRGVARVCLSSWLGLRRLRAALNRLWLTKLLHSNGYFHLAVLLRRTCTQILFCACSGRESQPFLCS
mmetsp:Transcript_163151/g.297578  ORF Transcript_163151/g.297578 Transcript_163151/m.297578 type:complete len:209 (+) Transcript_163151:169-795(+)